MKIRSFSQLRTVGLPLLFSVVLIACGGNGDSSTGGGSDTSSDAASATTTASTTTGAAAIGPDLNGNNWSGILKSERDGAVGITASIVHEGNQLTIITTAVGIGHELSGSISKVGKIRLNDAFDGEDWSSEAGNASKNSINITDYVAVRGIIVDRYDIFLKR